MSAGSYDMGQGGRVEVRIDKDIAELIPEYIDMTRKDIEAIQAALEKKDYETIIRLGHNLKGSGGGYGFDGITEIGRNIEQLAKNHACVELGPWVGRLSVYFDGIDIVYE